VQIVLVYPDGSTEDLVGSDINVGDALSARDGHSYVVSYVRVEFLEETKTAYLDPDPLEEARPRKVAFFVADGAKFPLSLPELAELRDRTRSMSAGRLESPTTAVAVRLEQLMEEAPGESPEMSLLDSEKSSLRWVIEGWLMEVGATRFPERVMDLRYALHAEANPSS
jgi:hypothetical protein